MKSPNPLLAKLSFNGYHVRYHDVYRGGYHNVAFETIDEVDEYLNTGMTFPEIEEFVDKVTVWLSSRGHYARRVMWVTDVAGHCLYFNPNYEYARDEYFP